MKIYSEILDKLFDTEKECIEEEKKYTDKLNEEKEKQANREKRIKQAYDDMIVAKEVYEKSIENYYNVVTELGLYFNLKF